MSASKTYRLQGFTLGLTMLVSFLGLAIVIPVFAPLLLGSGPAQGIYHLSPFVRATYLGLLIAAFPFAGFFGNPIFEAISNHWGRKSVIIISLLITAVGYALCAIGIRNQHLGLLFIARLIGGFGGASAAICMLSIGDIRDEGTRSRLMGRVAALGGAGFLVGPLLGGKLADPRILAWFNDATPFWTATILAITNAIVVLFLLRESLEFKQRIPYNPLRGLECLRTAFHIPSLRSFAWLLLLFGVAWSLLIDFFPVYLVQKWDLSPSAIGDFYIYITVWYFLVQWLISGPIAKYMGRSNTLFTLLLIVPFALLLVLVPQTIVGVGLTLPLPVIAMTAALPILYALIPAMARWESMEQLSQVSHALQTISYIVAPVMGGVLAGIFAPLPTLIAAFCALFVWTLYYRTIRTRRAK